VKELPVGPDEWEARQFSTSWSNFLHTEGSRVFAEQMLQSLMQNVTKEKRALNLEVDSLEVVNCAMRTAAEHGKLAEMEASDHEDSALDDGTQVLNIASWGNHGVA